MRSQQCSYRLIDNKWIHRYRTHGYFILISLLFSCFLVLPRQVQAEQDRIPKETYDNSSYTLIGKLNDIPIVLWMRTYPSGNWVGRYFLADNPLTDIRFSGDMVNNQLRFTFFENNPDKDKGIVIDMIKDKLEARIIDPSSAATDPFELNSVLSTDFIFSPGLTMFANDDLYEALRQVHFDLKPGEVTTYKDLKLQWYSTAMQAGMQFFNISSNLPSDVLEEINTTLELDYRRAIRSIQLFEFSENHFNTQITYKTANQLSVMSDLFLKNNDGRVYASKNGYNFDLATGKLIELSELLNFNDPDAVGTWFVEYFRQHEYDFITLPDAACLGIDNPTTWSIDNLDWYLNDKGINLIPYIDYPCDVIAVLPFSLITERKMGL
ncbi:hypothetical protein [Thorsellia anophelis]|uniref:DUF3298 domain-containing protein n=1 Tax=Thorsellia anophelis DSM 18579 TaxID=1123402 RepID=A0A1I0BMH5_9GAMM|nr:hypothetical protein [Thorsellia anophelis]SET08157.1 hypothetical protein SAMN02583745_01324 [Thorsellia anophelis DSM 18579]